MACSVKRSTTRATVVAGAPFRAPRIPASEQARVPTSDTPELGANRRAGWIVLAAGRSAASFDGRFCPPGARQVFQVEMPRLLMREDPEVLALVTERFRPRCRRAGQLAKAIRTKRGGLEQVLVARAADARFICRSDALLVAVGRRPTRRLAACRSCVHQWPYRSEVNGFLQTNFPNIYAAAHGWPLPVHAHGGPSGPRRYAAGHAPSDPTR